MIPSEPASANPWSAALSVCDDETLMAGNAKAPALAASSIWAYFSGVAIGMAWLLRSSSYGAFHPSGSPRQPNRRTFRSGGVRTTRREKRDERRHGRVDRRRGEHVVAWADNRSPTDCVSLAWTPISETSSSARSATARRTRPSRRSWPPVTAPSGVATRCRPWPRAAWWSSSVRRTPSPARDRPSTPAARSRSSRARRRPPRSPPPRSRRRHLGRMARSSATSAASWRSSPAPWSTSSWTTLRAMRRPTSPTRSTSAWTGTGCGCWQSGQTARSPSARPRPATGGRASATGWPTRSRSRRVVAAGAAGRPRCA